MKSVEPLFNLLVASFVVAVLASIVGGIWLTISHGNPAWLGLTAVGLSFLL